VVRFILYEVNAVEQLLKRQHSEADIISCSAGTDGYIQNVPSLGFIEAETSSMEIEQCLNSLNVLATRSRIAQVE
jgi:hypothetical protein